MDVKVGQVWRTKSDDLDDVNFEILCIGKSNAIVNMMYSDGHLECCKNIRHIQLSADLIKDSDTELSDLEIVQKALEKTGFELEYFPSGSWWIYSTGTLGQREADGVGPQSLLTWAKQTIGE